MKDAIPTENRLAALGFKPIDPKALEPFLKAMEEETIPAIVEYQRRQAVLCEQARRWVLF